MIRTLDRWLFLLKKIYVLNCNPDELQCLFFNFSIPRNLIQYSECDFCECEFDESDFENHKFAENQIDCQNLSHNIYE